MDELVRQGKRELTVIANDTARPGAGIGKLVSAKLVRKAIVSHIGLNPETQQQMIAGEMQVEFVPQGTLIERIRAGGYGLGGILTPTGVGTVVEEGKRKIAVDGKEYLLETALRADFALGAGVSRGLPRQPHLCADGAQLQPNHCDGRRYGHRRCGAYRPGRRDRAGSRGDAGAARRLPRRARVTAMDAQDIIAKRIARELKPACWSISASASRRWSPTTCPPACMSSSSRRTD